jgi:hypothetical protein
MRTTGLYGAAILCALVAVAFVAQPAAGQDDPLYDDGGASELYPENVVNPSAPANGCGPAGYGEWFPDNYEMVNFTADCYWHDRCYGTKGLSQSYCDDGMVTKHRESCHRDAQSMIVFNVQLGEREISREEVLSRCLVDATLRYLAASLCGSGNCFPGPNGYSGGQEEACKNDPGGNGGVLGDPHLRTFDGRAYTLQAAGEFALVRDSAGEDLVQARFYPMTDQFTVAAGVAVRIGAVEVAAQMDPDTAEVTVYVDGAVADRRVTVLEGGIVDLGERIEGARQVAIIRANDGLRVEVVALGVRDKSRLDILVHVPDVRLGGVSGLLGDADGDASNDLVDGEGQVVAASSQPSELHSETFLGAYRVSADGSMFIADGTAFDYHDDEIYEYPRELLSVEDFEPSAVVEAEAGCRAVGLSGNDLVACTYDVLVSGEDTYAETWAISAERARYFAHPHPPLQQGDHETAESTVTLALGDTTHAFTYHGCPMREAAINFLAFDLASLDRIQVGILTGDANASVGARLTLNDGTVWEAAGVALEIAGTRASWSGTMTSAGATRPATITIECST